jgi:hypothetical protein
LAKRTIAGKNDAGVDKIMYWYGDDILPKSLFDIFHKEIIKRFNPNIRFDDSNISNDRQAIRIRAGAIPKDDYMNVASILGSKSLPEVITTVKKYLTEDLNFVNPKVYGVWFQYMSNKQLVGKHFDNPNVNGKPTDQSFSAFLYMHQTWEDNWGGELCFNSGTVLPKPNRLIVYSREEEHWVNEIKHTLDDYQRMFVATSWSTD